MLASNQSVADLTQISPWTTYGGTQPFPLHSLRFPLFLPRLRFFYLSLPDCRHLLTIVCVTGAYQPPVQWTVRTNEYKVEGAHSLSTLLASFFVLHSRSLHYSYYFHFRTNHP